MRCLILALMIVLLPLRGWIGDAMAMNSATGPQIAIQNIATDVHPTLGSDHFDAQTSRFILAGALPDCADHAPTSGAVAVPDPALSSSPGASAHPDCADCDGDHASHDGTCNACQVCHTVAMSADTRPLPALALPAFAPATSFHSFTSALPAPGLKPPIS